MYESMDELTVGHYRVVVVDPPWRQRKTGRRQVRPQQTTTLDYPTLGKADLMRLPVARLCHPEQSFLFLWATNSRDHSVRQPILYVAFDLLSEWGFEFYTMLTWDKGTGPCPFGPYQITTEHVLVGRRGAGTFPVADMGHLQTCFRASPGRHSQKPAAFYDLVARHFPGPRIDLFARAERPGYDGWGDQYGSLPPATAPATQLALALS